MDDQSMFKGDATLLPSSLNGLRVLDLSRVLAGPWCAQILADLGAEVIKVERPEVGDDSRRWEPSFESTKEGAGRNSAYFYGTNRGKQSITVNIAKQEGADLIRRLAAISDVFIENYKVDDLARYGLSYAQLSEINPKLVYCSITGFGQTGPYRSRAGYDTIIQAMGGLLSITGERDDLPGGGPQRSGIPTIDMMTGVYSAVAILAALRYRDKSNLGQHLDLSLMDVQVSSLAYFGINYLATGHVQQRTGNINPVSHPSGPYDCADCQLVILVGNDQQFSRFCETIGLPDLANDNRFAISSLRVKNSEILDLLIEPALKNKTASIWATELQKVGVPCGPINDMAAVFADEHVKARGAVGSINHPKLGDIPILSSPIHMSATPVQYRFPPPMLSEHTNEVLKRLLGIQGEAINELKSKGVI